MNKRLRFWLILALAIGGVLLTLSLGRWQLSRAAQKEALQLALQEEGARAPLDNAGLRQAPTPASLWHRTARLQGQWIAERTVFLDNRQMQARVGFYVVTPLKLEGGGVILVQRGWAPRNFENRGALPPVGTPQGQVQVTGRIAPAPSKLYEPGQAGTGAIRQNLDLREFSEETGLPLLELTLQQTGSASEGLLREWPEPNLGIEKHYGYAFQWFALSALIAFLALWFQGARRFFVRSKESSSHAK